MKNLIYRTKFTKQHSLYIGFFVFYALITYIFLYHLTGLQPFQVNMHFFSNFAGSFLKRVIADAAPLILLLYLAYHSKKKWSKVTLISLFVIVFTLNLFTIFFYYVNRFNWNFDRLSFTPLLSFLIITSILIAFGVGCIAFKQEIKEEIWPFKKRLFITLLVILTVFTPFIPVRYSTHKTLVTNQKDINNTFRTFYLEKSSLTHLFELITNNSEPTVIPDVSVFEDKFKKVIESK